MSTHSNIGGNFSRTNTVLMESTSVSSSELCWAALFVSRCYYAAHACVISVFVFNPEPGCGPPPHVKHAEVQFSSTTPGSIAEYVCHPGFASVPRAAQSLCSVQGEWSQPPVCKGLCQTSVYKKSTYERSSSSYRSSTFRSYGWLCVYSNLIVSCFWQRLMSAYHSLVSTAALVKIRLAPISVSAWPASVENTVRSVRFE